MSRRVDDLTCCRAIFAAWVFFYHLDLQLGRAYGGNLARRGYLGVDAFFVLSGIVLAYAYPDIRMRWGDLWRFWARRLLRIYPAHLAMIAILGALLLAGQGLGLTPRQPLRFGSDELIRHLLLAHAWGFSQRWAWNYPSWSISAEWAGYLAFPMVWLGLCRAPGWAACTLAAASLIALPVAAARGGHHNLNFTYDGALWRFAPEFLTGMLITRAVGGLGRGPPGRLVAACGLGAVALGLACLPDAFVVGAIALCLTGLLLSEQQ